MVSSAHVSTTTRPEDHEEVHARIAIDNVNDRPPSRNSRKTKSACLSSPLPSRGASGTTTAETRDRAGGENKEEIKKHSTHLSVFSSAFTKRERNDRRRDDRTGGLCELNK